MMLLQVIEEQFFDEPLEATELADAMTLWYYDHKSCRRDIRLMRKLEMEFPYSGIAYRLVFPGLPNDSEKKWREMKDLLTLQGQDALDENGRKRLESLYKKYANEAVRQYKAPKYDSWSKNLDSLSMYYGLMVRTPNAQLRIDGDKGKKMAKLKGVALIRGHIEGIDLEKACIEALESEELHNDEKRNLMDIIDVKEVVAAKVISQDVIRVGTPIVDTPKKKVTANLEMDLYEEPPF